MRCFFWGVGAYIFRASKVKQMPTAGEVLLVQALACFYYLLVTRCEPTPLADSLSPEQKLIKARSSAVRGAHFWTGVALGVACVVLVRMTRPLRPVVAAASGQ